MSTTGELNSAPNAPLSPRQVRLLFTGVMFGMALAALDGTIVNTALSTIVGDLGGLRGYAWVGTIYLLTSTASTPLFGKLSDLYGRRPMFELSILIFVVSSALCGQARNMTELIIARGLQGIGGGGLMALAFTIMADAISPRERGRYMGAMTSVFTIASVVGPLLGGFFVDHLSWRWIFYVNLPVGLLALVVSHRALDLPFTRRRAQVDFGGALLLTASVSCLLLLVAWTGESYGWFSGQSIAFGTAAVILGYGFIAWEARASEPIVPLHLFRVDVVRIVVPMMVLTNAVMYGSNAFMPLFLQGVTGVSPTNSGLLMVPLAIGVVVSATLVGRETARTGKYKLWPIVGAIGMLVGVVCFVPLGGSTGWLALAIPGLLLFGLGIGALNPTATMAVQNAVQWRDMGAASSLVMFMRSLGGAVGLAIYGTLFNAELAGRVPKDLVEAPRKIHDLPQPQRGLALNALADSINTVFFWSVPVLAGAVVFAFLLPERPLRTLSALESAEAATPAIAH